MSAFTKLTVRAAMARRGLLRHQLSPYENPDTERMVYPRDDDGAIAAAWEFIAWLNQQTADALRPVTTTDQPGTEGEG